ncbi:unnamed protein product [Laminaria digitata]
MCTSTVVASWASFFFSVIFPVIFSDVAVPGFVTIGFRNVPPRAQPWPYLYTTHTLHTHTHQYQCMLRIPYLYTLFTLYTRTSTSISSGYPTYRLLTHYTNISIQQCSLYSAG